MISIDLSTENYVVTGAAGSIGREICRTLARAGAHVVATDINAEAAQRLIEEIRSAGGRGTAIPANVVSRNSVSELVREASESQEITGLVNAAGILRAAPIELLSEDDWNISHAVNVTGTFNTIRAIAPRLRDRRSGSIVNLGSVAAYTGSEVGSAYHSTKGAVLSLTYATAGEFAPFGVRVNAVCPGWVDGGFTHEALAASDDPESLRSTARQVHYLGRMATTEDVANAVLWLMSPLAAFVTGSAVFVDGGFMIKR